MATYLTDVAFTPDLAPGNVWPALDVAQGVNDSLLQTFGQLLDATTVDLVSYQPKDRATAPIAEWARDHEPASLRLQNLTAAVLQEVRPVRWHLRALDQDDRVSTVAVEIARRTSDLVFLVIHFEYRSERPDLVAVISALVSVLRHSFALEARVLDAERKARAAVTALDQDKCGIIAISAEGQVAFTNRVAAAALSDGTIVQLSHNTIRPTRYLDAVRFATALDSIVSRRDQKGCGAMIMLLAGDGLMAPMIVSIAPFDEEGADASRDDPVALVHLFQPQGKADGLGAICQLFGLTPIEAQFASHLFQGQTLADAAHAMHIKVETARSYLKQIFAKTETHRQADLLALLSQYSLVVRNTYEYSAA